MPLDSQESAPTVMLYAHIYLADHLISSLWSFYFFQVVYYFTEHNGQPPPLSAYQSGLMALIESIESQYETKGDHTIHHVPLQGDARVQAAQQVWKGESSFSGTVLVLGWAIKIYFALLLYSYALHLRHGTYKSLPLSKPSGGTTMENRTGYLPIRASISIERPSTAGQQTGGSARTPATLEDDLPGWSDDEMDEEESSKAEKGTRQGQQQQQSSSATGAKQALDRLSGS